MTSRPGPELQELIGEVAFVRLAETFGGTRLYVPERMGPDHAIVAAIGEDAAALLADRMAPDVIEVPLAREARARQYRGAGDSNAAIARALGITERGVVRLFGRMDHAPAKGSAARVVANDDRQLDMFSRP